MSLKLEMTLVSTPIDGLLVLRYLLSLPNVESYRKNQIFLCFLAIDFFRSGIEKCRYETSGWNIRGHHAAAICRRDGTPCFEHPVNVSTLLPFVYVRVI
jgi:hypothetical protein